MFSTLVIVRTQEKCFVAQAWVEKQRLKSVWTYDGNIKEGCQQYYMRERFVRLYIRIQLYERFGRTWFLHLACARYSIHVWLQSCDEDIQIHNIGFRYKVNGVVTLYNIPFIGQLLFLWEFLCSLIITYDDLHLRLFVLEIIIFTQ